MARPDLLALYTPPDRPWPEIENPPATFTDDWYFLNARKAIHTARRRHLRRTGVPGDYTDLNPPPP
ncbi:hypothetical protein [Glycomyces buryatensis]|uniref:Uncharacterized protein n=1 Tax=Glycomyces buryatensis TaxID=2570927 RepID=A0A4S8Q043_9ACTN|nr:hypothetical protein [Glycomyces buryatensis]THV33919.1 hypothetical protein FAB82_24390 [Glycomyces buryatensis]